MNQETYIIIGICVLALIVGVNLKKRLQVKEQPLKKIHRGKAKYTNTSNAKLKRKERIKRIFTIAMLVVVFGLLIFEIPALSRSLLSHSGAISQTLILRIIIVAFAIYILMTGFLTLRKNRNKEK